MISSARLQQNNALMSLIIIWYPSHRSSTNSICLDDGSTRISIKSLMNTFLTYNKKCYLLRINQKSSKVYRYILPQTLLSNK